ncbi:MAG: hypothetical protein M0Q25_04090 [Sulfurospirillaceae bacterium]|nr:hypothetical protein [Sulfurospirillaceae bacterium]MDY0238450.1 hypothetical protein [Campylobacterales bacterium]
MSTVLNKDDRRDIVLVGVPAEQVDFIKKFFTSLNTGFNLDIKDFKEIKKETNVQNSDIKASHKEFFEKYVGIVKGSTTDEEADEYRMKKYVQ